MTGTRGKLPWLWRFVVFCLGGRRYQAKALYGNVRFKLDRGLRRVFRPVESLPLALHAAPPSVEHAIALPEGFGARRITVRLSAPQILEGRDYAFSEHVVDSLGNPTSIVTACTVGGFAISEDLGRNWKIVKVRGFARYPMVHSKMLPSGDILLQATDPYKKGGHWRSCLLLVSPNGEVLSRADVNSAYWHGPRSVDVSGDTIMYAEYTPNLTRDRRNTQTMPSRVFRSRDSGRSWTAVFEAANIRHFHFLQARPGSVGEWWLTSGDSEEECRIWKSTDDGDTWVDLTVRFGISVESGSIRFTRRIFRLTDLAWSGDSLLWGSDDPLKQISASNDNKKVPRGSRAFRWNPGSGGPPEVMGFCGPPVRSMVELANHYVLITQAHEPLAQNPPRVLLMAKRPEPGTEQVIPLFEIEKFSKSRPAFTYSRASRAAKDGVFFTFRNVEDVFNHPGRILRWEVLFD